MRMKQSPFIAALSVACLTTLCIAAQPGNNAKTEAPAAARAFDAAPFAVPFREAGGKASGLRWAIGPTEVSSSTVASFSLDPCRTCTRSPSLDLIT